MSTCDSRGHSIHSDNLPEHWGRSGLHERRYVRNSDKLRAGGHPLFLRKASLSRTESGRAGYLTNLACAIGENAVLRSGGISDSDLGLDKRNCITNEELGSDERPFQ